MKASKNDFKYNYNMYYLINLTKKQIVDESDDLEYIQNRYNFFNTNGCKWCIQKVHTIATIVK